MRDNEYSNEEIFMPVAASGIIVATICEKVEEKSM